VYCRISGKAQPERKCPMATKIGELPCNTCVGGTMNVNEAKGGTLSLGCTKCKAQTMVKSPDAVAALRKRLANGNGGDTKTPAAAGADNLESFFKS